MKVLDLNEFLRRAVVEGIQKSLVIDFRKSSSYGMGTGLVTVSLKDSSYKGVIMKDERGTNFNWGLDYSSSSAEIIDLRRVSGRVKVGAPTILVKVGRKCSGRGEV